MKLIQTRKGLAERYGVHPDTIKKWLRENGITHRGGLKPLDVEKFIQCVGSPLKVDNLFK
jgi:transposase-like protein